MVERSGNVIAREFGGASHIDPLRVIGEHSDADALAAHLPFVHPVFPAASSRG